MFKYYYFFALLICTYVVQAQQSTNAIVNTKFEQKTRTSPLNIFGTDGIVQPSNITTQPTAEEIRRKTDAHIQMMAKKRSQATDFHKEYYNTSNVYEAVRYNYENTFEGILKMLEGKEPLNLKKAVYLTEHAFESNIPYDKFSNYIKNLAYLVSVKMQQEGRSLDDNTAFHKMIQKFLSDTISLKLPNQEEPVTHYPFRYNFEDFIGEKDWTNMFVSKLLWTHSGQCHSMPLLYLLLAEELGLDAYWSFSPSHSYIKFKDKSGMLRNYETTCGYVVSDQFIMGSGFVKSSAIKNKIYMDTLSKKETIAYCLNDLASGYEKIFGYTDTSFLLKCIETSLKYFPERNLAALQIKSNLYLDKFQRAALKHKVKSHEEAMQIPEIKTHWEQHKKYYLIVQDKGFSEMPKEVYRDWLKSIEAEKIKQSKIPKPLQMFE